MKKRRLYLTEEETEKLSNREPVEKYMRNDHIKIKIFPSHRLF